jgi:LacI family transcriptional regulator
MSPTIYDVARHAGVGVGTVSRVLNDSPRVSEATRQKVLAAIEELDYHPSPIAQRLSLRKTFAIGVIAPFATQMYPKLYPFSISRYIDITSALCYTGNG